MPRSPIRVLVVDDHEPWRRFVCSTLQKHQELQVIGEVDDGLTAVRMAQQLQPDLILLDIGLPTLNGIEAARRIREVSPKSRILFVSENRSPDIASEALNTGAGGYVVKSNAGSELFPAVKAVLQGKKFVSASLARNPDDPQSYGPKVITFKPLSYTRRHEAQFYSDDASLLRAFTRFIGAALKDGNAAIVVATKLHRDGLLAKLQMHDLDVGGAIERGRYIAMDAADALSTFMVNDLPDRARFLETAGHLITSAAKSANRVAICGECDPPLWTLGKGEAAVRLEQLWNDVIKEHDVDILCAYPLGSFYGKHGNDIFQRICAEHSAVHTR